MKAWRIISCRCLAASFWLMALVPLPTRTSRTPWLVAVAIRCIWVAFLLFVVHGGWKYAKSIPDGSGIVSAYVGIGVFLGHSIVALILIGESILKGASFADYERRRRKLQLQRLCAPQIRRKLLILIFVEFALDIAKTWANANSNVNPVHAYSMPHTWLLRFRFIQLLQHVMELNQRCKQLKHSLIVLAARIAPISMLWQPSSTQECDQLLQLRLNYQSIFECFGAFNNCYGWGMLALLLVCSLDIISNAYWTILSDYTMESIHYYVYNGCTSFATGLLIVALFWSGDRSSENSRQIGCLISKLAKPLGSKRYNDLVSEFSLQALHQRFVVTAKDFFNLNLHLLSSMFAAVVTYLVILLQFMVADKNSTGRNQIKIESIPTNSTKLIEPQ
ncbi:gustatory receptor 23a [Scaptodrosophila lebanonensis]|uniref:Gustatory receptor n=1 Tax=Drosophila lebanonensis TaxID=7225 RepID=A0A6J2U3S1_DROLE|nr:gustatory receptor 23a [Scaptodrosophila lebanonensis]